MQFVLLYSTNLCNTGWRRRVEDGAVFWNLRKTLDLPKLLKVSLAKVIECYHYSGNIREQIEHTNVY